MCAAHVCLPKIKKDTDVKIVLSSYSTNIINTSLNHHLASEKQEKGGSLQVDLAGIRGVQREEEGP